MFLQVKWINDSVNLLSNISRVCKELVFNLLECKVSGKINWSILVLKKNTAIFLLQTVQKFSKMNCVECYFLVTLYFKVLLM
ncbi:hypothetical protein Q767_10160 [Flavobacterium enshiense DK69]|uniref:Uncharacterized protein n=1 Tax=Flavobacterium enshiense DK69 TaxID=1107311 RepID=A0A0A2N578_9FLAO|nr:hypothetical protein Q767_10160 [Flavobacterium enshiense DK69]